MKKVVLACLVAGAVSVSSAFAATVKFHDGPGNTGGGEFYADIGADNVGPLTAPNGRHAEFITFCLEYNETIRMGTEYNYVVSQSAKNGGLSGGVNGQDPISKATAWLYLQFLSGTLVGYDHTTSAANALQRAIWWLEGEVNSSTGPGVQNAYANLALAAVGGQNSDNNGFYNVGVMNITDKDGRRVQDQLIRIHVPDGGASLVLLGMAMAGLTAVHRRFRQS